MIRATVLERLAGVHLRSPVVYRKESSTSREEVSRHMYMVWILSVLLYQVYELYGVFDGSTVLFVCAYKFDFI